MAIQIISCLKLFFFNQLSETYSELKIYDSAFLFLKLAREVTSSIKHSGVELNDLYISAVISIANQLIFREMYNEAENICLEGLQMLSTLVKRDILYYGKVEINLQTTLGLCYEKEGFLKSADSIYRLCLAKANKLEALSNTNLSETKYGIELRLGVLASLSGRYIEADTVFKTLVRRANYLYQF